MTLANVINMSGNAKQLISVDCCSTLVRACGSPLDWVKKSHKEYGDKCNRPQALRGFKFVGQELDADLQKGGGYSQALRNLTVECHSNFLMLIHAT